MNRFAKECFKLFSRVSSKKQFELLDKWQHDIQELNEELGSDFHYIAVIKNILKKKCYFSTISGRRSLVSIADIIDPLLYEEIWMPNGKFTADEKGRFIPLGNDVICTKLLSEWKIQKAYQYMHEAWRKIAPHLLSHSLKDKESFDLPVLLTEPLDVEPQHVYFVKDGGSSRIKIGISKSPIERLKQISRTWGCENAEILCVLRDGGRRMEVSLHRKFAHLRIRGMGKEWFRDHPEIHGYISTLISKMDSSVSIT